VRGDGKYVARLKGANITPGYWRAPALTAGLRRTRALQDRRLPSNSPDPADPTKGLLFDGRLPRTFKLGDRHLGQRRALRAAFVAHCAPAHRDVVLAGPDRDEWRRWCFFPILDACRELAPGLAAIVRRRRCSPTRVWSVRSRAWLARSQRRRPARRAGSPRHADRRAALPRYRRDDRQRLDQPARGACQSRRAGGGTLTPTWPPAAVIIAGRLHAG